MTHAELIKEIMQLPLEQRMELLETISRSVREEMQPRPRENSVPLSQRLYGILKFDGDPPTDEELKNHYADYLLEKYS